MNDLHIYKVGMGSAARLVEAPNAKAAALFYGVYGANTNNAPFMVAVYEKDGVAYEGDPMPWSKVGIGPGGVFSEAAVKAVLDAVMPDLDRCHFVLDMEQVRETLTGLAAMLKNALTEDDIAAVLEEVARRAGLDRKPASE